MSVLECKVCGGLNELPQGTALMPCRFCGCQMTLPVMKDENHAAAFNRGNHFRRIGEFDKAMAVYERIVQEDETNAEAHWCCALCRFGIEYVKDPVSGEYLPTCHRASFDSFQEDVDYRAALEHADETARAQYQQDAEKIAQVLHGILATCQKEPPFDVFICYKETGADGQRTRDSQLAQDIYYQLTDHGLRVFFARITLEDKAGTQYEPYIFAALNSAKVMVVVGTEPAHLNAVWVRNEWSRYLAIMKRDRTRLLIPCYRDMDPYDMPEQLSILQSYDMSRIGFVQDLVRGIRKVVGEEEKPEPAPETVVVQQNAAPATEPLLRRVALFLEDGDWQSADEYCEKVLDADPECARAYVGKLMAALHVTQQAKLCDVAQPFDGNPSYRRALRFADEKLKSELQEANRLATQRRDLAQKEAAYIKASEAMIYARTEETYKTASKLFTAVSGYKDASEMAAQCLEKAENARKDSLYEAAAAEHRSARSIADYEGVMYTFKKIAGWRDADERIRQCQVSIDEIRAQQTAERERKQREQEAAVMARQQAERKKKTGRLVGVLVVLAVIAAVLLTVFVILPASNYHKAEAYLESGDTALAAFAFGELGNFKDAHSRSMELWDVIAVRNIIAKSDYHTVGLRADGTVVAVGRNDYGQCDTSAWMDIVAIAAGDYHTVGLRADGTVVAVGDNSDRQCKTSAWSDVVAIAAGYSHTVGLRADGTVVAVGDNDYGQRNTSAWSDVVAIAAGGDHTVGLRVDGTVVAVGDNEYGQCDTSAWSDIVAIAAGDDHTVGLRADGTVVAVGGGSGVLNAAAWSDIVAIAADGDYTVGLRADGTVVVVGDSNCGQWETSAWSDVDAIAAGHSHTVGLRADGTVVAVGSNASGQCNTSAWSDIVAVAAGWSYTVGLRADGTVVAVGWNDDGQCKTSAWSDVVAIAAGYKHTVGLRADGTVVAVGDNEYGQCDTSAWSDIVAIAAGFYHTVGLRADGTVVAVGNNTYGQCDTYNWKNIVDIDVGTFHTVGLRANGSVVVAGDNDYGQHGAYTWWGIIVDIAAGGDHTVGLRADGTVVAVGDNGDGQCNTSAWSDIVAIAAGYSHTVGLRADGTVVVEGCNSYGQCSVNDWRLKTVPRPKLPE